MADSISGPQMGLRDNVAIASDHGADYNSTDPVGGSPDNEQWEEMSPNHMGVGQSVLYMGGHAKFHRQLDVGAEGNLIWEQDVEIASNRLAVISNGNPGEGNGWDDAFEISTGRGAKDDSIIVWVSRSRVDPR